MSKRIVVDPITRIEGHLRVEVVVDENNIIKEAYSSSTLWRGLETIVKGRDPRDVGFMIQRICGVCTYSHYRAGIVAVENALGIEPPLNAKLVRSLMTLSLNLHDHIVHFYHLHGLDWCDVTSALKADPAKASQLAFHYAKEPIGTGENELKSVQNKVAEFVKKGNLGPFANAYWGHKTYRFSPEQNLIVLAHYLKALEVQRIAAQMLAIFGAKNPHPQSLTVGGVTCVMDILDPSRMGDWMTKFQYVSDFVNRAYYPDILMTAEVYKNEPSVMQGCGVKNFLSYKEIPLNHQEWMYSTGIVMNGDLTKVHPVNDNLITEEATHSWYKDNQPLHPYEGKTTPEYTGFHEALSIGIDGKEVKTPVINEKGKYSWIKSPRYNGEAMEVGPLATIVVGLADKNKYVQKVTDQFLKDTGLSVDALCTTLGRTAARALECKMNAEFGLEAFHALIENLKTDQTTYTSYKIDPSKEYKGRYFGNAPRGALSHWIRIKNGIVENYQAVVPSTWNAGPIDAKGIKGPYEASLIGMKIENLTQPLEIIRTIHSFDPCIACAVHVLDTKGHEISRYKVGTIGESC